MLAFLQHTKTGRMDQHSLKKFNKLYILLKYLYLKGFIWKVFVHFYSTLWNPTLKYKLLLLNAVFLSASMF